MRFSEKTLNQKIATLLLSSLVSSAAFADWSQFGGPQRNFKLGHEPELAAWGDAGPQQLWSRELGPGYSALVAAQDGERLFTQSRDGDEETIVALDVTTGETLWQTRYSAPTGGLRGVDMAYGNGPQATPLLVGGRLFGLGFTGVLWAADARDGSLLWSKQLGEELKVPIPYFGHAASPLWVPDAGTDDGGEDGVVVVLAGGALAFDPATGALRWQNREFGASYASPVLLDTAFGRQIVASGAGDVVGLDPQNGELLWRHEYRNQHRTMLATPILIDEDLLFVSTYFLGSRGLRLVARDRVEQVWEQPEVQVSHFNAVLKDDIIYTTYRNSLMALDARRGEILWRERRFGDSNLLLAGEQTLLLGENGELVTAVLNRDGLQRRQSARLLEDRSWTPPTVLGDRLYLRGQRYAVAYDLSAGAAPRSELAAQTTELHVSDVQVPDDFERAIVAIEAAARRADVDGVEKAAERFDAWAGDAELGTWAAYYQTYGYWVLSQSAPARQLTYLDKAVEAGKRAVELDHKNADAHALLGSLYPLYYRLAPRRGSVVGFLGQEHLGLAEIFEPDNAHLQAIQALSLVHTPAQFGGDAEEGVALMQKVVDENPLAPEAPRAGASPTWLPAMGRAWLARLLLGQNPPQEEPARKLLDEVLESYPDHALAARLRSGLGAGS